MLSTPVNGKSGREPCPDRGCVEARDTYPLLPCERTRFDAEGPPPDAQCGGEHPHELAVGRAFDRPRRDADAHGVAMQAGHARSRGARTHPHPEDGSVRGRLDPPGLRFVSRRERSRRRTR